jgi:four helix bundle protein
VRDLKINAVDASWVCPPIALRLAVFAIVLAVYRYSESFPEREKYGLAHQLRRAAVSIPANIAEGFGKRSQAEKARFLNIAEGSVEECRYYLILSQDLGYGQSDSLMNTLEETSKLLNAYARAILASGS